MAENDDTVIPVNLATGNQETPITVANTGPIYTFTSALAVTPDGKTLYAAVNGDYGGGLGPNSLVAISTATGTVAKTIPYGHGPIALAVTPGGRTLYVLNGNYGDIVPDDSTVTLVSTADGRSSKAIRTGGLFGHTSAFSFAITPDGRTAYVAQGDVVAIGLPRLSRLTDAHAGRSSPAPHSGPTRGWCPSRSGESRRGLRNALIPACRFPVALIPVGCLPVGLILVWRCGLVAHKATTFLAACATRPHLGNVS